jgi:hypothetical protein
MAKESLDIANLIYLLRFRVVWRLACVTNTFARTFARFARTLPTQSQNKVAKSVIVIIILHNYGKFRQFLCIFNNYNRFGGLGV